MLPELSPVGIPDDAMAEMHDDNHRNDAAITAEELEAMADDRDLLNPPKRTPEAIAADAAYFANLPTHQRIPGTCIMAPIKVDGRYPAGVRGYIDLGLWLEAQRRKEAVVLKPGTINKLQVAVKRRGLSLFVRGMIAQQAKADRRRARGQTRKAV